MTVDEVKNKIKDLINTIPEENLVEIYRYIQNLRDVSPKTIRNTKNLSKIIAEDRELLK